MRTLFALILALAVTSIFATDQDNKKKHDQQPSGRSGGGKVVGQGNARFQASQAAANARLQQQQLHHAQALHSAQTLHSNRQVYINKTVNRNVNITKIQRFNLGNRPNASIPAVQFHAGARIVGSERWVGPRYVAFRNYTPVWHDRVWWVNHHSHIVFVFGAPYYWDAGYWYPAWGYYPAATYYYEGPIYAGSAEVDPGQIVANVQTALQDQGYYQGDIDGVLGPLTRAAIASYQNDHGLYATSAIDEPTLESLGLA